VSCPDLTDEEVDEAKQFLDDWQLDFVDFMKTYTAQLKADDSKLFELVFWTSRTAGDILADASSADFGLLSAAYVIMIVFASLAAVNFKNFFASKSEASAAGVLLVLYSVLATIGLGSLFQIKLSPNIIQVLPFIALGFGVDDMFVLLFSFKYRENLEIEEMISETTRIAGSSVALTSLANLLGFIVGTTMVLPDVARFATFGAIVVALNFLAVIFGFTAVLTLVARRMKNKHIDWSFLFCFADFTKATTAATDDAASSDDRSVFDPLFDFLALTPVRVALLVVFITLVAIGGYGCTLISPGLPLADIVPANTYGSDFLSIREKFYFTYPVSLYSDAQLAQLTPIDWPNQFEVWVNRTEDIFTISEHIYSDPNVHEFWAWGLRDYLQTQYAASLTMKYSLGAAFDVDAALGDDPVYQAFQCYADVQLYCSSLPRVFSYGSDLYHCLLVHYQANTLTDDDCHQWVEKVLYENIALPFIARQIEIVSFEDDNSVNGLYVRPSSNDIKVYIKHPNNDGYIYQEDCGEHYCEWFLLDENFKVLYVGQATSVKDTQAPAQNGWSSISTPTVPAKITHVYYDFYVSYFSIHRDLSTFLSTDIAPSSTFTFSNLYQPTSSSSTACRQWDVMRLLMQGTEAFNQIAMTNVFADSGVAAAGAYDVKCDAILESSEMCASIRDESTLGSVNCGRHESTVNHTLWYLGNTTGGLFQIVSSPGNSTDLIVSTETFENCEDPTQFRNNTNLVYNFLKPCGSNTNFGGFGLSAVVPGSHGYCNTEEQTIGLQCQGITACTDLRVCYKDHGELQAKASAAADCTAASLTNFDVNRTAGGVPAYSLSRIVESCYFRHYDELSSCCQTAVKSYMLSLPQYTCSRVQSVFNTSDSTQTDDLKSVCGQMKKCQYSSDANTCTEVATGSTFEDCAYLIENQCKLSTLGLNDTMVRQGNQQSFSTCLATHVTGITGSDLCNATYTTETATYSKCLYPVKSFWDFDTLQYDYSMCTDAEIAGIPSSVCGATNFANSSQLQCLQTNVANLPAGCCKRAIEQISSNSYAVTNECEADADKYCASLTAFSIDPSPGTSLVLVSTNYSFTNPFTNASVFPGTVCLTQLLTAAALNTLSPKCALALGFCEPVDSWPATMAGATASIPCGEGYTGTQTRPCVLDTMATWSAIDNSTCEILTCPEVLATADLTYNQYWPQTAVGSVYTIQGGLINSILPINNLFTTTQISTALQQYGNVSCSPLTNYNIYYARRKCELNPYNTSQAIWADPLVECKPFASMWTNVQPNTTCDFLTEQITATLASTINTNLVPINPAWQDTLATTARANLIDAIVWSIYDELFNDNVTSTQAEHIALSQAYCSSTLTNCAAFTYDEIFAISYFFDYCPLLTDAELQGNISAVKNSPAAGNGALTALAQAQAIAAGVPAPVAATLTANVLYPWSAYPDPIYAAFLPQVSATLDSFARRHTTYISPLSSVQFIATYCSIQSIQGIAAGNDVSTFIAPNQAWNERGIPKAECFNNTLWLYFIDPMGGVLSRDSVVFTDPSQVANVSGFDKVQIVSTYNSMVVKEINDDAKAVQFILDLRSRLDSWAADDALYVVPGGLLINLFSQYIGVSDYMVKNLLYVSIAISLCGLIFLLDPIAVIVAIMCNTAMIVEVYGFSDWIGLRVNGVLVLNIVIAVALTMEFTAHVGRAFVLTAGDDGQARLKQTLREMFTPVTLGALTTLIGVVPIAFAQFPYFRQYYFSLYVLIVVFGWLNGVVFQVVILSFLKPRPLISDEQATETTEISVQQKSDNTSQAVKADFKGILLEADESGVKV